jgi:hypothetical protein
MPDLAQKTTRRVVVLGALAALSAAVIVASVAVKPPQARGALAGDATAIDRLPGATSSQWSCAGPLPVGSASVLSAIELANSGRAPVEARFSFVTSLGANRRGNVSVPPGGVVVVRPPEVSKPGFAAAGVVAQGSGLSVAEVVHSPEGPDAASCARSASTTAYLVAGDTRKTDDVMLSLYDPGATPAVADVSVTTPSGVQSPPALQGLPIGAGQVATYSIAQRVPFVAALAITVRSSAGSLVVGGLSSDRLDGTTFEALEPGILSPSPEWSFSAAPAGPDAQQTIDLFNPTPRSAKVAVTDSTSSGTARIGVIVPADAVARVPLPTEPKTRALGSVEVHTARGVPLIAARTTVIGAAIPAAMLPEKSALQRARRALDLVPRTPVGYTVTNGTPKPARFWLVDGGEHDRSDATELVVTNPNGRSVRVTIRPAGAKAPWISGLVVNGGTTAVVDFADLPEATGRFGLVVEASAPVIATGTIYANGSIGFTSPAAIPFG